MVVVWLSGGGVVKWWRCVLRGGGVVKWWKCVLSGGGVC